MVESMSGYGPDDVARWAKESPKNPGRGAFARDRARVVHSSALRRLAAKTQVVEPDTDDFVRNRLTHSLEVAQVGRELGQALGCDGDVVDTACLAHDLGHPPFGHNGEDALDAIAAGFGGFEGNAQTLRVLTRLEPKVIDPESGAGAGLNLTRATLDACTKYPWGRGEAPTAGSGKFGVYADDRAVFAWLRAGAPAPHRRCIEAQVMDLADDIAYSVHDVEDAVVGRRLDLGRLGEVDQVDRLAEQVRSWYLPDAADGEVAAALHRLQAMPTWVSSYDGSRRASAALKDLTSQLIGRFARDVERATRAQTAPVTGGSRLTRYAADVVVPRGTWCEIATLKGIAAVYVMTTAERQPLYARQRELLAELYEMVLDRAPEALEPAFAADWTQAAVQPAADDVRRRVVIDQIASLTDAGAVRWHAALRRGRA